MDDAFPRSPLVAAILGEIRQALAALIDGGSETTVDLGALPLSPAEAADLDAELGTGEVSARIDACGQARLHETRYAGVWRIDHLGPDGSTPSARFIEVTLQPSLVHTPPEDAADALARLGRRLAEAVPAE